MSYFLQYFRIVLLELLVDTLSFSPWMSVFSAEELDNELFEDPLYLLNLLLLAALKILYYDACGSKISLSWSYLQFLLSRLSGLTFFIKFSEFLTILSSNILSSTITPLLPELSLYILWSPWSCPTDFWGSAYFSSFFFFLFLNSFLFKIDDSLFFYCSNLVRPSHGFVIPVIILFNFGISVCLLFIIYISSLMSCSW